MNIPHVFQRPPAFDPARFANPPAIDRGAPFWAWNGPLEKEQLFAQLATFKRMGLGGAHLHPRTGLATPYMSEAFLDLVQACAEESDRLGLLTWLYDEDRWPSGFGGGLAVEEKAHWCRHLRLTRTRPLPGEARPTPVHHGAPLPQTERVFVAAWALMVEGDLLSHTRQLAEEGELREEEIALYAYLEIAPATTWFNNRQYVDSLNPQAMRRFLDVTHEAYAARFRKRFGRSMPAIFTDEPLFRGQGRLRGPDDEADCQMPWTDTLPESYAAAYDEELLELLPRVLFDCADGSHTRPRWRFWNHLTDRFVQAFAAQLGAWCGEHGLALTGHMMAEGSLADQTRWTGETMRSLRHFQLPGIDMLCDSVEYATAKQAQSISRQTGAPGVLSELYGVTNWDFPFAGHKRQGDWQAALGVTTRVHHLTWYQMGGESKRDYPASFGQHVPWADRYPVIEEHFARLNAALRSGNPRCRVAMIHPIESYWVAHGPDASKALREELSDRFTDLLTWLLESLLDVDLISEATLPELCPIPADDRLRVGEMSYEVIVVPPTVTLRSTTLDRIEAFARQGGTVIGFGRQPTLLDGEPSARLMDAVAGWSWRAPSRESLCAALTPWRDVDLLCLAREPCAGVVHQLRELPGGEQILFVCRVDKRCACPPARLRLRGEWLLDQLDTATGERAPLPGATVVDGWTEWPVELHVADHLLVHARPGIPADIPSVSSPWQRAMRLPPPHAVVREERNVLLLDRAAWRIDEGDWQAEEDVLRVDNLARKSVGLPYRHGNIAQPWVVTPPPPAHRVTLRYALHADAALGGVCLALEQAAEAQLTLDGAPVRARPHGWWLDTAFETVALGELPAGDHTLEVTWPFGEGTGLEACYLLGDFSVRASGVEARLGAPSPHMTWGDIAPQGLAFYGGNVTYRCRVALPDAARRALSIPSFSGALCTVRAEGRELGPVFREPWRLELPDTLRGSVELEITCYGNRFNTFGQLHNTVPDYGWWGPASWRTTGDAWCDDYLLRPMGVLEAPVIETREG